jgi:hypothetical protein
MGFIQSRIANGIAAVVGVLVKNRAANEKAAQQAARIDEILGIPASSPAPEAPVPALARAAAPTPAPVRSAAPAPTQFAEPTWTPLTMSAEQAAPMQNAAPAAMLTPIPISAPAHESTSVPMEFGSSKSSLFMTSTGEEYNEFLKLMQQGIRPYRKPGISVKDEFELWLANKAKGPKAKKERAGLNRLVPSGKSGD